MEEKKTIDLFEMGKDTFNFHYNNLKDGKKSLKNYLKVIDDFLSLINGHKKSFESIYKEIKKNASIDKPYNFLKKLEILITLQYHHNKVFLGAITNTLENLKKEISSIMRNIGDYLSDSQQIVMNIKNNSEKYFKKYDILMESLEETEMSVIEEYAKKKYRIILNKQKNKDKGKEQLIKESLALEREFLNADYEMKGKTDSYIEEYNSELKNIKTKMNKLNDDTKEGLLEIMKTLKTNCNNFIVILKKESVKLNNIDDTDIFKQETRDFLNYSIKKDSNCEIIKLINLDKYNLKILNNGEKNLIESINQNNAKQSNKKAKSHLFTDEDIYNIVKELYDANFEMIKKDSYKLDIEKTKIKIMELMGKLLNYNFDTHEAGKEKMTEKEKKEFIDLLFSKEEYLMKFLLSLNNYRTTGRYEMTPDSFNTIKLIFDKAANSLFIKHIKKVATLLIILSQTFFVMKDNNKYFLQKELKKNEFYRNEDFWKEHLNNIIQEEITKFDEEANKNKIIFTEERKKKKIDEILFTKIASLIASLNGFELEREKIDNILLPIITKYNLPDEIKKSIFALIQ